MEWYIGTGADDFVVPKEESDMLWMEWGINAPDSFWLPQKHFASETKRVEEVNKTLFNEVDTDMSTHESSSSVCEDSSEAFGHGLMLQCDWPDHQLDYLAGINEMDDIFINSLLEDLPVAEGSRGSFCFPPKPISTTSDDLLTNTMFDSQIGQRKSNSLITSSHFIPCNSRQNDRSFLKENVIVASEKIRENKHTGDKTSMGKSVLQELGIVMELMSNKTRMCFRDSLYRLAENSKQLIINQKQQDESPKSVRDEETLRPETTEEFVMETNTIDRAIANLLFYKRNGHDVPVVESDDSKQGIVPTNNYNLNQVKMLHFSHDAQVPNFGNEKYL